MRSSWRVLGPGLGAFLVALLLSGVLQATTVPGLPTTPLLTLTVVPVFRLLALASGALALGGLVVAVLSGDARVRTLVTWSAAGFAAANALLAVATLADVLATQWWQALDLTLLQSFLTQIDEGRYFVLQVLIGGLVALLLPRVRSGVGLLALTLAMAIAVSLPGFTGHSTAALPHWVTSTTMILHLLAMSTWVGGITALLLIRDSGLLRRFAPAGMAAYVVLVLSGVASVVARTADWSQLASGGYGFILALKLAAAVGIGVVGARIRRRLQADTDEGMQDTRRLLQAEASTLGFALALAVVLARMPNP